MDTMWINIVSVYTGACLTREDLAKMAIGEKTIVIVENAIYPLGFTLKYELRADGDELWAEVPIWPELQQYSRVYSVIKIGANAVTLLASVLTNRNRSELFQFLTRPAGMS